MKNIINGTGKCSKTHLSNVKIFKNVPKCETRTKIERKSEKSRTNPESKILK